ncbi:uncharacterized protein LOC101173157 isoform X2 [Oryzias latipes]|uniref:uncharacterized protein LOC101173157 isoform X2 n=1 Tax=Oryzias latipes TaxID=8090 RepID=UPI0002A4A9DB|nr:uncharacterized protein LOC101173157 isoform X2 [Oryzias latipes]
MRFLGVFLAAAAFQSALSASIQSASNEEKTTPSDGLTELQKIDQMEFEAAQKAEEAQMNVTEGRDEDVEKASAGQEDSVEKHVEAENDSTGHPNCDAVSPAEGAGNNADSSTEESNSCEDAVERPEVVTETTKLEETSQTVPAEEDVLE